MESLSKIWFKYFEPKGEYLCKESRENFKQCIASSNCYKNTENFKKCATTDIDFECIALRKKYSSCKRLAVDRTKDFRSDERTK